MSREKKEQIIEKVRERKSENVRKGKTLIRNGSTSMGIMT